jgi:hypothetical protein
VCDQYVPFLFHTTPHHYDVKWCRFWCAINTSIIGPRSFHTTPHHYDVKWCGFWCPANTITFMHHGYRFALEPSSHQYNVLVRLCSSFFFFICHRKLGYKQGTTRTHFQVRLLFKHSYHRHLIYYLLFHVGMSSLLICHLFVMCGLRISIALSLHLAF